MSTLRFFVFEIFAFSKFFPSFLGFKKAFLKAFLNLFSDYFSLSRLFKPFLKVFLALKSCDRAVLLHRSGALFGHTRVWRSSGAPCGGVKAGRSLILLSLDHSDKVIEHTEQVGQHLYGEQSGGDSQAGDEHDGHGVTSLLFESDLG